MRIAVFIIAILLKVLTTLGKYWGHSYLSGVDSVVFLHLGDKQKKPLL